MRRLKYGRLYWLPLKAKDLGRDFIWRLLNKLGIKYIPFSLRFYDELYLREDVSKYSRRLIYECRKHGIITYVVQEGPIRISGEAQFCHLPLYADVFLCPEEDYDFWVNEGMPKQSIKTYKMQKMEKEDYEGVVFLRPMVTWRDMKGDIRNSYNNVQTIKAIRDLLDKDVVFKLPKAHPELIVPLLPPHRVVVDNDKALLKKYRKVYCFSDSPLIKDCQNIGIEYEIIDKESQNKAALDNRTPIPIPQKKRIEDYEGIFFLRPFHIWDNRPFNWRKDYFNMKAIEGICDMLDKDVVFKPHQSYPHLIMPLLPPDRIVRDRAEDLIKKYKKIYCFSTCSVRKDCEMLGREYEIVDKED